MALFYDPAADLHTNLAGGVYRLGMKAEQMVTVMMEYAKVDAAARDVKRLGIAAGTADHFKHCPACADCMLTTLEDGE